MAKKLKYYRFFADLETPFGIVRADSPGNAKRLGRKMIKGEEIGKFIRKINAYEIPEEDYEIWGLMKEKKRPGKVKPALPTKD